MSRTKRTSKTLEKATLRFSGLRSIDETLDYGNGLSVAEYETRLNTLQAELIQYNSLLSTLDEAGEKINTLEKELRTYAENILLTTQTRYGKTSLEYMKVGGKVRKPRNRSTATNSITPPIEIPTQTIPTNPLTAAMN